MGDEVQEADSVEAGSGSAASAGDNTTSEDDDAPESDDGDPDTPPPEPPPLSADEQLCLDLCLNYEATDSDCGRADASCFGWCLGRVDGTFSNDCLEESRAAVECEAEAPQFDAGCSTSDCAEAYLRLELCSGYCSYLGGSPGSGASQTDCNWRSSCSDGRLYEMVCAVGDAGTPCDCLVDDEIVGTCEAQESLPAFECGGDDLHVFSGCCRPFFEEVLLP